LYDEEEIKIKKNKISEKVELDNNFNNVISLKLIIYLHIISFVSINLILYFYLKKKKE